MKKEAEAHAAEDAKNREAIEVKNQADSLVYSTERTLSDHGDKVPAEDKQAIEAALNEAREALKSDDLERIKKAQEELTKASHKLAEVDVSGGAGQDPAGRSAAWRQRRRRVPRVRRVMWSTPSSRISARRSRGARRRRLPGAAPPRGDAMTRDYYAVLGMASEPRATQIRRAYQRLARHYSPDVNLWERDTQSLFEEIVEAYRVLSDPMARSVYDRQGGARLIAA